MRQTFLWPVFLVLTANLSAQKIDSALNVRATQHPSAKIYIHYDKEYYVAGETIWFKAYLYSDGKPSGLSTNLYLQFTDNKGQVIFNKRYPVTGAVAKGNIDIPDSLSQDNYYIRAFTAGMLNDDDEFIYSKNIFILKPSATINSGNAEPQNVLLQFFPESGNLVDGILTVTGFKATDQWGTPVDVKGVIRTEEGITVAPFMSYHDGIGKVQFKPQAGKKYIAEAVTTAGLKTYTLPPILASGINLKVLDEKGGKKFQLSRSEKGQEQWDSLLLVIESNNHVVYENQVVFENYLSIIGHLVTDSLPSGILHFTVFNKERIPLAERLSFVDNGEYRCSGSITITKAGIEKRTENMFEINFADSIQRSCSVAVIDLPGTELNDNDNIWSRFLLTSDLKGYIHNPSWYFAKQNDTTKQALDNLMLTHGWSRFKWSKISAKEFPQKKYSDSYLINISGIVYREADNKPAEGGKLNVFFSDQDSSLFTYDIQVNEKGQFLIDSLAIFGKTKIYYSYKDKKGKEIDVTINTDNNTLLPDLKEYFSVSPGRYPVIQTVDAKKTDIARRYEFASNGDPEAKLLENVTVTAKQMRPVDIINEKYTSELFSTGGKIKIDNINFPPVDKAMNAIDFILNRITTIGVQNEKFVNRKNFSLQDNIGIARNQPGRPKTTTSGPLKFWEVGLFINEMRADLIQLQGLRADQIAMVKFFEAGSAVSGSEFPGGAVAVYLNYETGNQKVEKKMPKSIEYNGYSITREFYSPDYSIPGTNSNRADNRTTLYWNPEIFTGNQSRTFQLKFFNNDFSKKFKIVVEGFDSNGRLIHIEKVMGN